MVLEPKNNFMEIKMHNKMQKLYGISKTLRFELIPQRETLEKMKEALENDKKRADTFKNVKGYCDEIHKNFIDERLKLLSGDEEFIDGLVEYYNENQGDLKKIKTIISSQFKNNNYLWGKDMHDSLLKHYKNDPEKTKEIESFKGFTTYFKGYETNRENIYENDKATSIANRLMNDNYPIFVRNFESFKKIMETDGLKETISKYFQEKHYSDDFFKDIKSYTKVLTQGDIEKYNIIISGKTKNENNKEQGINEYVNEYNQSNKTKVPKLEKLKKQILSDRNSASFKFDIIESNEELIEMIDEHYEQDIKKFIESDEFNNFKNLFYLKEIDPEKVFINSKYLNHFSNLIWGKWNYLEDLGTKDKDGKRKEKEYSLKEIENFIKKIEDEEKKEIFASCHEYLEKCMKEIIDAHDKYKEIKKTINNETKIIYENIEIIKTFLDLINNLQNFIKCFFVDNPNIDLYFYNNLEDNKIKNIIPVYNKARNFLTKKPYSLEKIRVMFDKTTLLNGWDANKESKNLSVIFEKNERYYLGIMNKKHTKIFDKITEDSSNCNVYKKMEYKLYPGSFKMIPKCSISLNEVKEHFEKYDEGYILSNENFIKELKITKDIFDLYKNGKFKKEYKKTNEKEYEQSLKNWIDFCFDFLASYKSTSIFDFTELKKRNFENISDFYNELDNIAYKISFKNIDENYIHSLVNEGKLYLFQIYNKDFSEYSKGTPNLHTMYWKALFDSEILKDVVYKLNGEASVFWRKASLDKEITHPKGNEIKNRRSNEHGKEKSLFKYDLIKNKRFTEDKFQFHAPITMNFKSNDKNNINKIVQENIKNQNDIHVIGIDRGERNLIYISVIDSQCNILEQVSLNKIINEYNGNKFEINYHKLLDEKGKERKEEGKKWKTITKIKELKEGYISQVIHKISELALKYNAVIAIENLNFGFKKSRIKIEKQVYQKFENMLISKLNYLVIKNKEKNEIGGILNAYQLTDVLTSSNKNAFQSGILFRVLASYTSDIDPVTGFVNLFKTKYENLEKTKDFFKSFEEIKFNEDKGYFEFIVKDYSKFNDKYKGTRKDWVFCTYGERIGRIEKNEKCPPKEIKLTEEFKAFFRINLIDDFSNIKKSISEKNDKSFFEKLLHLFALTVQMRNSDKENDYIISPVSDKNGDFFDSRKRKTNLPIDADANGAYNIARKCLIEIDKIKKGGQKNTKGGQKKGTTIEDWIKYAQSFDKK